MNLEDNLYRFLPSYAGLPGSAKNLIGKLYSFIPLRIRYGTDYKKFIDLVQEDRPMSNEQIESYRLNKLNEVLRYSLKNVKYYRDRLVKYDINFKSLGDWTKLPLLSKEELRNNSHHFISDLYNEKDLITISTGGSTGEPLLLYYEKGVVRTREFVYLNDQFGRVGYKNGDLTAVFRSALVRGRENNNLWEYEPIKNRWIYSSYDLTKENLPKIIEHLRLTEPKFLHVYPSALTIIANYMKINMILPIPSIKGILSGSENTYPYQLKLFEEVFNCKVFRWYGLGELSALAGSCENTYAYHCYNTYSFVELIDENGKEVTELGKVGEIVGTTFENFTMPLLRYRTGDFAVYGGEYCESCKRHSKLFLEVQGRKQEKVVDKYGNILSLGPFIFGIHDQFWAKINAIQFVQEEIGKLKILASSEQLDDEATKKLVNDLFQKRTQNNFEIEIIPVDKIPRTNSGKHNYIIQKLHID